MGTRHRQAVISKDGELKIQQYGQWDGYPSGQGVEILQYLRNGNLEKYYKNLLKIHQITDEQIDEVNSHGENWSNLYPYLSRDCGSKIHQMIENGEVKFVQFIDEDEAHRWCEGFYTIDFQNNLFSSEFHGISSSFDLNELPSDEEYLKIMEPSDEEE